MPDRTAYGAYKKFVEPLERAIACVAKAKINVSPRDHALGRAYVLYFADNEPVRLKGDPALVLDIGLRYEIIHDDGLEGGLFKVKTRWYQHSLSRASDGKEVIGYHWHPDGVSHELRPHVHVGSAQLRADTAFGNKRHIMTGRCSVEQVIRTAIEP